MCPEHPIEIKNPIVYFTSFIENISDLLTHYHKDKYLNRARSALEKLISLLQNNEIQEIKEIKDTLLKIHDKQKICNNKVLNCEIFHLMYDIINCIILIIKSMGNYYKENSTKINTNIDLFNSIVF